MCPFKGLGVEYILCLRLKLPHALPHEEGTLLPALSFPVILLQLASSGLVFLPQCPWLVVDGGAVRQLGMTEAVLCWGPSHHSSPF